MCQHPHGIGNQVRKYAPQHTPESSYPAAVGEEGNGETREVGTGMDHRRKTMKRKNPVAKFNHNRPATHRDRTKYTRKIKHRRTS